MSVVLAIFDAISIYNIYPLIIWGKKNAHRVSNNTVIKSLIMPVCPLWVCLQLSINLCQPAPSDTECYCKIIFICWTFIFVHFVGKTIHEYKILIKCWFNLIVNCVFNLKTQEFKRPQTCPSLSNYKISCPWNKMNSQYWVLLWADGGYLQGFGWPVYCTNYDWLPRLIIEMLPSLTGTGQAYHDN